MAVSLKWRKLWDLTEMLKFCENEPSDPQFVWPFKQKYVNIIQNPLGLLSGCLG
jgi:hypothetical protein